MAMNFLKSPKPNHRTGRLLIGAAFLHLILQQGALLADDAPPVTFSSKPGHVEILVGDRPFAIYVYQDEKIPRPYFCSVRAPDGTQVTRNHPPVKGTDLLDHATMHPGIWLAFGDISGADFWRNKARVAHERFVEEPVGKPGVGSFAVQNVYSAADDMVVCREIRRYTILVRPIGCFLLHDSEFYSDEGDFVFGDQEEMGLGVRMATPLIVKKGGRIANSDGLINEKGAWGRQAAWCDYSGVIGKRRYGITSMPYPENFRDSWFHARDYGLLAANPSGRNAFTRGGKSAVVVKKGERFKLRFGLLIYSTTSDNTTIPTLGYQEYLRLIGADRERSDPN